MKKLSLLAASTAIGALLCLSPAHAELIFEGSVDLGGTGLGAVDTILTMTSHGSGTSESGQVSWSGSANVVTPDPNPPGFTPTGSTDMTGINHTITVSQTGFVAHNNQSLGIVFNPAEPGPVGGAANSITLNNLVMTIYGATTGNVVFTAPWLGGPMTLQAVDPGTGNSGFLFDLNLAEAVELNNSGVLGADRIGLLAYATDATGGQETFFGTVIAEGDNCPGCGPNPQCAPGVPCDVPEPGTFAILGSGIAGLFGIIWYRRRKSDYSLLQAA